MSYSIQIFMHPEWKDLILYEAEEVDRAVIYCHRALMNFKVNARIMGPDGEIVYEKFYNRQEDPDYRDWERDPWVEDDVEVDWRKAGF